MKISFLRRILLVVCNMTGPLIQTYYMVSNIKVAFVLLLQHCRQSHNKFFKSVINMHHDIDEQGFEGDPICVSTLSSHWRGPLRWSSIQHGVLVTVCLRYSAPQPFTKDILIVHMRVNAYTASKPWLTDCDNSWANSWLLKIFKLHPGGILQTVAGCQPYLWLQLGLWTNILLSLKHSANTSPPI